MHCLLRFAVYGRLSGDGFLPNAADLSFCLRNLRLFCRNNVAGSFQPCRRVISLGRNGAVCASCAGRRYRLLLRSCARGSGFPVERKPSHRDSLRCSVPRTFIYMHQSDVISFQKGVEQSLIHANYALFTVSERVCQKIFQNLLKRIVKCVIIKLE